MAGDMSGDYTPIKSLYTDIYNVDVIIHDGIEFSFPCTLYYIA